LRNTDWKYFIFYSLWLRHVIGCFQPRVHALSSNRSARHCLEWLSSEQKIMRAAGKQKLSIKTTSVQTQNTTLQLNSLLKYPTFLKH